MPSPSIPPMDELEAVNEMLESIGQAPVSSLATGLGDVSLAQSLLRRKTRSVQLEGFDFNTDENYALSPNADGVIVMPQGILRLDPVDPTRNLKRRRHPDGDLAFWDGDANGWTFTEPVPCRIVWAYAFEDMPDTARHYVALSAARKFQKRIIGSDSLDGFNAEDEMRAWMVLHRDERANRDTNLFRRNPTLAAVTASRRY